MSSGSLSSIPFAPPMNWPSRARRSARRGPVRESSPISSTPSTRRVIWWCKPSEQWAARQQAVAAELKRRYTKAPKPIEVDSDADGRGRPTLFSKITEKDVEEQYAKMTGACNVSTCILDQPQMRRLLTCAALAGKNILSKNTRGDTPEWAKDLGYHAGRAPRRPAQPAPWTPSSK